MVTAKDIENLAKLARIELLPEETEELTKEIDSILGYVGQIQGEAGDLDRIIPKLRNVMRDDVVTNSKGEYTERLLKNSPSHEGQYIKVKKIL